MKKKLRKLAAKLPKRRRSAQRTDAEIIKEAAENAPRITNETVAEHREEVLSSARKYIYPLQHSKHKIVLISTALFIATVVFFMTYCTLALYRLQNTSTFMYRVTQVLPFPVAKAGKDFVAYENYLFELRHYMHYYQTQQKLDFASDSGKQQLADFKKRALQKVINDTYIKELAKKNKVSISNQVVDDQITIVRNQNRLGGSDQAFEDVLKDYWGWSADDFKRSLKQQLLAQKLVSKLDTQTHQRADAALAELNGGADFSALAKKYSDDVGTKDSGGEISILIDKSSRDVLVQTTDQLFKLKPGQTSGIIDIGYGLEIVKVLENNGDKVRASHIVFNFKDISTYLNTTKDKQKARLYIKL
ncbi:MAG: Peptidylprolyl isomerase [Candidatus Saccharibacteria bacterium]|nr:Peptidylprolyl isomerase [Candidatus Saccharibacteria bacterium]